MEKADLRKLYSSKFIPESYHGRNRIIISPSPVAPHAPTSASAYAEDPAMGPSPTLAQANRIAQKISAEGLPGKKHIINR